jgi:hypothetical protein
MTMVRSFILGLMGLVALTAAGLLSPATALAKSPVLVELFTSQGCSSCTKADGLIAGFDDRPGVLGLTFAVDYWDYLGWRDTFARPEYSERQRAYMKRLALREVYTPQVVVGGASEAAGIYPDRVDALIKANGRAKRLPPPQIRQRSDGRIAVGSGRFPKGGAEVWLIRYDPNPQSVDIKRGENRGRAMVYRNVVRELVRLGSWSGKRKSFALPAAATELANADLKTVIVVQGTKGGRVLGLLSLDPATTKP